MKGGESELGIMREAYFLNLTRLLGEGKGRPPKDMFKLDMSLNPSPSLKQSEQLGLITQSDETKPAHLG